VFTRTKHGADRVVKSLLRVGIHAQAIHGNKSQNARQRALAAFKSDAPPILVATDIAARGLDIDNVSHVINYEIPNVPETYVHRIGRTARAGASGVAVSFCDHEEREYLRDIQKLIRRTIPVVPTPQNLALAGEVAAKHHHAPERHAEDRTPMRQRPPQHPRPQHHEQRRQHQPHPRPQQPQTARASLAGYGQASQQHPARPQHGGQHSGRHANGVKLPARPQHPNQGQHRPQGPNGQPQWSAGQHQQQGRAPKHKVGGGVRRDGRPAHPLSRGHAKHGGHQHRR